MRESTNYRGIGQITVLGELRGSDDLRLLMIELSQGGSPMSLHFDGTRHYAANLGAEFRAVLDELAQKLVSRPTAKGASSLNLPLFDRNAGDLHFQTATVNVSNHGTFLPVKMDLLETNGTVGDLFARPKRQENPDILDDVFIPLTNLAAYLRSPANNVGGQDYARAQSLTADRIEEFLLSFGERMKTATPNKVRFKKVG